MGGELWVDDNAAESLVVQYNDVELQTLCAILFNSLDIIGAGGYSWVNSNTKSCKIIFRANSVNINDIGKVLTQDEQLGDLYVYGSFFDTASWFTAPLVTAEFIGNTVTIGEANFTIPNNASFYGAYCKYSASSDSKQTDNVVTIKNTAPLSGNQIVVCGFSGTGNIINNNRIFINLVNFSNNDNTKLYGASDEAAYGNGFYTNIFTDNSVNIYGGSLNAKSALLLYGAQTSSINANNGILSSNAVKISNRATFQLDTDSSYINIYGAKVNCDVALVSDNLVQLSQSTFKIGSGLGLNCSGVFCDGYAAIVQNNRVIIGGDNTENVSFNNGVSTITGALVKAKKELESILSKNVSITGNSVVINQCTFSNPQDANIFSAYVDKTADLHSLTKYLLSNNQVIINGGDFSSGTINIAAAAAKRAVYLGSMVNFSNNSVTLRGDKDTLKLNSAKIMGA